MYNGNVQQNPSCTASCVTKNLPISPRFSPTIFYCQANSALYSAQFLAHSSPIDAPCILEAHYTGNKKGLIVFHSTAGPLTTEYVGVSTCNTRMYRSSSMFYAQTLHSKLFIQSVKVYLHMYSGSVYSALYT